MGIYAEKTYAHISRAGSPLGALAHTVSTPGLEIVYVYELAAVIEHRTNCFCCSCGDSGMHNDPACRNHGWAAVRPCEKHEMPGQPWGDELEGSPDYGKMPESVQEIRSQRRAEREARR